MPRAFPDPQFDASQPASLWGTALCAQLRDWLPQDPREISDEALAAFMADCKACIKEAREQERKHAELRAQATHLEAKRAANKQRRAAVQVLLLLVPVLRAARVLEQRRLAAHRDPAAGRRFCHRETSLCSRRLHCALLGAACFGTVRSQLGLPVETAPPSAIAAAQGLIERHPRLFAPVPSNWRVTSEPSGQLVDDEQQQRAALLSRILRAGILDPNEVLLLKKCLTWWP